MSLKQQRGDFLHCFWKDMEGKGVAFILKLEGVWAVKKKSLADWGFTV